MRKNKKGPYILLGILTMVIVFLVGTRYGQRVEQTNKTIDVLLSITPTQSPTPIVVPTITYTTFIHKNCVLSLLYPSSLDHVKESSHGAILSGSNGQMIDFVCGSRLLVDPLLTSDTHYAASSSVQLGSQTVRAYTSETTSSFIAYNPITGLSVYMKASNELLPLLVRSLQWKRTE